jgi:tape measure domain-containing protein
MSRVIDERIVSMQFDNKNFEQNVGTSLRTIDKLKHSLNFKGASEGFDNVSTAAKKCNFAPMSSAVDAVKVKFSAMQVVAITALTNITNSAMAAGKRIISSLTIDPIKSGLQEYETQLNSVQTILANTQSKGSTLDDVNMALDELNKYADMTIYNFTEMTRNIGTFTAAGIELDKSVSAIKGIANLAAISGSTSQQASTAMYQLSQAMASGTVKLMDWNSVVNAGMGGQVFQDALKRTATIMGTDVDAIIKRTGSFRESLSEGWITAEVLTKTLEQFTMAAEEGSKEWEEFKKSLMAEGYTEAQAEEILEMANTATDAATKVKTATQLFDVLKEAVQSGWAQTWELIIGDFEEAKELWTGVSDVLTGIVNNMSDWRNNILFGKGLDGEGNEIFYANAGLTSNWDKMILKINEAGIATEDFEQAVIEYGRAHGYNVEQWIEDWGSIEEAIRHMPVSQWSKVIIGALEDVSGTVADLDLITRDLKFGFKGDDVKAVQQALVDLGYDLDKFGVDGIIGSETTAAIKAFQEAQGLEVTGIIDEPTLAALKEASAATGTLVDDCMVFIGELDKLGGREMIIESFANVWKGLQSVFSAIKSTWQEVFPPKSIEERSQALYGFIEKIHAFSERIKEFLQEDDNLEKIKLTFKGLFDVLNVFKVFLGGGFGLALKLASKVLSMFGMNFLDVTAMAGQALTKFAGWIPNALTKVKEWFLEFAKSHHLLKKLAKFRAAAKELFSGIKNRVIDSLTSVKKWFDEFMKSHLVLKKFAKFRAAVKDFFHSIPNKIVGAKDAIVEWYNNLIAKSPQVAAKFKEFLTKIKEFLHILKNPKLLKDVDWSSLFTKALEKVKNAIANFDIKVVFQKIKDVLASFGAFAKEKLESIGGIFSGAFTKISDFLAPLVKFVKEHKGAIIALATIASIIVVLMKIKKVLDIIASPFDTLGGAFEDLGKTIRSFSTGMKAKAVKDIAIGIGIIAASIYLLGQLETKTLWSAVGAVAVIMILLTVMAAVVGKMSSMESKGSLKDRLFGGLDFAKLAIGFIGIAGAIFILAKAAKEIGSLEWPEMEKAIVFIGGFLLLMGMFMGATKLMGAGSDKAIHSFGNMMLKLSVSLMIFVAALKLLGGMDGGILNQGMDAITQLFVFMGALMAVSGLTGEHASKFGGMMVKIGAALVIMAWAIKIFGKMDPSVLKQGKRVVIEFMAIMAVMMLLTKFAGENSGKFGAMMLGFGASLYLMAGAIGILGNMDASTIKKGEKAIAGVAGIMIAMMVFSKLTGENSAKFGVMMISFAASMLILVGSIAILGAMDKTAVDNAIDAMQRIGILFGILMVASHFAGEKITGTLVMLSIAIGVMAGAIAALTFVDDQSKVDNAVRAISSVMGMFAILTYATKFVGAKAMGTIIAMTVAVGALAGLIYLLAKLPNVDKVVMITASLSAMILSLSAACALMALVPISGAAMGAVSFGVFFVILGAILVGIGALNKYVPGIKTFIDESAPLLESVGYAIGSIVGGFVAGFSNAGLSGLTTMAEDFKTFIDSMVEAITSVSEMPEGAVDAVGTLTTAVLKLAAAEFITAITDIIGISEEDTGSFGDRLKKFGEGISAFSKAVSGENAIDPDAVKTAAEAAAAIIEVADDIPNSGGWLGKIMGENDVDTFGGKLKAFGEGIVDFSKAVSGEGAINKDAMIAAAEGIAGVVEVANSIPNSGGWIGKIMGENDIDTFGSKLKTFGEGIVEFSSAVSGEGKIDKDAMITAVEGIKGVIAVANTIPNTGGWLAKLVGDNDIADFGTKLGDLGTGISSFSKAVSGDNAIDVTTTSAAAQAVGFLAEAAAALPDTGGLFDIFDGIDDLDVFCGNLSKLGSGIKDFSDNAKLTDPEGALIASEMARNVAQMSLYFNQAKVTGTLEESFVTGLTELGTSIAEFSTYLSDNVDTELLGTVSTLSTALSEILKIAANDELDGVKTTFSSVSSALGDFVADLTEIDTDTISTKMSAFTSIDFSKITSLGDSLAKLGENSLAKFIASFNDSHDKVCAAGETMAIKVAEGVGNKADDISDAGEEAAKSAASAIKTKTVYDKFVSAGKYLGDGLVEGINAKKQAVYDAAYALGQKAVQGEKDGQASNSPSKLTIQAGNWFGEGLIIGINQMGKAVYTAGHSLGDTAIKSVSSTISKVAEAVNSDIDTQPTIRPVLDLSDVRAGANSINGMFGMSPSMSVLTNVGTISKTMNNRQNGTNNDVISAINDLGNRLGTSTGDTYQFGNITYDDGSGMADAVQALVRAARIERRK